MDILIGYSVNKVKNIEVKKFFKYYGSKRLKVEIIFLFKERKRNLVWYSIDLWN